MNTASPTHGTPNGWVSRAAAFGCAAALVGLAAAAPTSAQSLTSSVRGTPAGAPTPGPRSSGLIDPLAHDGVASPPATSGTRRLQPMAQTPSATVAPTDMIDLSAAHGGTNHTLPYVVPDSQLPYAAVKSCPLDDPGVHDAQGVRMFYVGSTMYDHPVGQAQLGINCLGAYAATQAAYALVRAEANAQRLIDRRVESRGAWFYPYPFDFAIHGDTSVLMTAPWYSAMAQGQALSLFVMLWKVTGDPQWRTAADATVASLALGPSGNLPFVSYLDPYGYLWLEEYARLPISNGEKVFNGLNFAIFGLYDYWRTTGSTDYVPLMNAALETSDHYAATFFERPQWVSKYSVYHAWDSFDYHPTHRTQMLQLHGYTRRPAFAAYADKLVDDYPSDPTTDRIYFSAGAQSAYRFDNAGGIVASQFVTLPQPSFAPSGARKRIRGRGIYSYITAGRFAGWWVPEVSYRAYPSVPSGINVYDVQRGLAFAAGTYTGYAYSANGALLGTKTWTLPRASSAPIGVRAMINARPYVLVSAGVWKGYWLQLRSGLVLQ